MNIRIRDLALEAIVENISAPAWVFTDDELEYFVQLIIQECIDVHVDDYGLDIIGDEIKEHFGVKK